MKIDIVTGLEMQVKRTSESTDFDFDFSGLMDSGETIASVNSVSQVNRGVVTGSTDVTIGTATHDSNQKGQVRVSAGTSGEYYCLKMLITSSTGEEHQCSGVIYVKDVC